MENIGTSNVAEKSPKENNDSVFLEKLEKQEYLKVNRNIVETEVEPKIKSFLEWYTDIAKKSLLTKVSDDSFSLLYRLGEEIKLSLSQMGKSASNRFHNIYCTQCNEIIVVKPEQMFWETLQEHEHFESVFANAVQNYDPDSNFSHDNCKSPKIEPKTKSEKKKNQFFKGITRGKLKSNKMQEIEAKLSQLSLKENGVNYDLSQASTSAITSYQNKASTSQSTLQQLQVNNIPQEIMKESTKKSTNLLQDNDTESFAFKFEIQYDERILKNLYPSNIVKAGKQIDKTGEFSVQRSGPNIGKCLLCCCEIGSRGRFTYSHCLPHLTGQRHISNATNAKNVEALKNYHQTFKNLDTGYQTHQVYFMPEPHQPTLLFCHLCKMFVTNVDVVGHVSGGVHKDKVLTFFKKKDTSYYLLDVQISVYEADLLEILNKENIKNENGATVNGTIPKNNVNNSPKTKTPIKNGQKPDESLHHIIRSVKNPESENILDLVPNRYKGHVKFLKATDSLVTCNVCKENKISSDKIDIIRHILTSQHMGASKLPKEFTKYFCEICFENFTTEEKWISHFIDGPNRHNLMAESRKAVVTEYECTKCCVVIYGDELSLTRHKNTQGRKSFNNNKKKKLSEETKKIFKSSVDINKFVDFCIEEANLVNKHRPLVDQCCRAIEETLQEVFPNCKAHPFGSRVSGLGNIDSDLDVFLDTGDMFNGLNKQDILSQQNILKETAKMFRRSRNFDNIYTIAGARTPIVQVFHKGTELDCDISFRHGLSVENTKFLRTCFELQPKCQELCLILKYWSAQNELHEHISTYALTMMAIFFMQINGYLFSVNTIRQMTTMDTENIDGWETIKYTVPVEIMKTINNPYTKPMKELLKEFFTYYFKFNYQEDVVCPLLGEIIKKTQFNAPKGEHLPPEMRSYIIKLRENEDSEEFRYKSECCIQDPFDLSHNLTKALQIGTLNKLTTLCGLTLDFLNLVH